MDFTLSEDQELLRDTARQLLARECPTTLLRAHIDDPTAADPLWRHLKDFAALGDGPLTDLCLFVEETGYVAAPGPFFPTAALFAPLLAALGSDLLPSALSSSHRRRAACRRSTSHAGNSRSKCRRARDRVSPSIRRRSRRCSNERPSRWRRRWSAPPDACST